MSQNQLITPTDPAEKPENNHLDNNQEVNHILETPQPQDFSDEKPKQNSSSQSTNSLQSLLPFCEIHKATRCRYLCLQDNVPFCDECLFEDKHAFHKKEKLDTQLNEINNTKNDVYKEVSTIVEDYELFRRHIVNQYENMHQEMNQIWDIVTKYDKVIKQLQEKQDQFRTDADKLSMTNLSEYKNNIDQFKIRIEIDKKALSNFKDHMFTSFAQVADRCVTFQKNDYRLGGNTPKTDILESQIPSPQLPSQQETPVTLRPLSFSTFSQDKVKQQPTETLKKSMPPKTDSNISTTMRLGELESTSNQPLVIHHPSTSSVSAPLNLNSAANQLKEFNKRNSLPLIPNQQRKLSTHSDSDQYSKNTNATPNNSNGFANMHTQPASQMIHDDVNRQTFSKEQSSRSSKENPYPFASKSDQKGLLSNSQHIQQPTPFTESLLTGGGSGGKNPLTKSSLSINSNLKEKDGFEYTQHLKGVVSKQQTQHTTGNEDLIKSIKQSYSAQPSPRSQKMPSQVIDVQELVRKFDAEKEFNNQQTNNTNATMISSINQNGNGGMGTENSMVLPQSTFNYIDTNSNNNSYFDPGNIGGGTFEYKAGDLNGKAKYNNYLKKPAMYGSSFTSNIFGRDQHF